MGWRSRLFLGVRTRRHRELVARAQARQALSPRSPARHAPPPRSPTRQRDDAGVTLIELVIAFVVLAIILIPIAMLLTNVLGQSATARDKLTALSLAEQCLEKLNNTGPTLSDGVPETSVAIGEDKTCFGTSSSTAPVVESTTSYDVHAEFTWETSQGDHPDLCTSSDTATLIEAQVWTTWGRTQKVTDTTLLDYPPPGLPDDGFLAVVVNGTPAGSPPTDAKGRTWATRVQSVPVTISRTGFSATLYPNSYGCVFEEVPAPDSYTVTASNPTVGGEPASPAWASASETATAAKTVTADLGSVTHVTLRYDEGTVVKLQYPSTTATEGPVTCPGAGQVQCVVFGQEPSASSTPAKAPDAEISVLDKTTGKWKVTTFANTKAARFTALGCAGSVQCVAVGYSGTTSPYAGVSLSSGTAGTPDFAPDTGVPSGVTTLSGITCPTTARCYSWRLNSSGAVILTGTVSSTSVTWGSNADTLATTPARVTSIACWSATRCYALGTKKTATTPIMLSLTTATSWKLDTLPATVTSLTQLACPAATKCYAIGARETETETCVKVYTSHSRKYVTSCSETSTSYAAVISLKSTGHTWQADTSPTTVTSLTELDCPASAACYAVGATSSSAAIVSPTSATKWTKDTLPTTKSIAAITCTITSTTACLVMGTSTTGTPMLLWRTAATTFASETVPTVTALSAIACATSAHCFATGSTSTSAAILYGTTTWKVGTLKTATPAPVSFFGLACDATACTAPGATETAAVYFDGAPASTTWSDATPSGAKGMYVGGVPIAVTNSGMTTHPLEVTVPSGTKAASTTPALFPFSSGYGVAATECKPLPASAAVSATPGSATSTATMPMGLLSIRAVNAHGNPDTGATITASLGSSCTEMSAPTGETNPSSLSLEPTGPSGVSQVDVPYGSYKLKVTHSSHTKTVTVTVSSTSVAATGSSLAPSSPVVVTIT